MNYLQEMLYDKMSGEQREFLNDLQTREPGYIIDRAYEIVMREDILSTFESEDFTPKQVRALMSLGNPLESCYRNWCCTDCSHMKMLKDAITDFAGGLAQRNKEKSAAEFKKAAKKKNYMER